MPLALLRCFGNVYVFYKQSKVVLNLRMTEEVQLQNLPLFAQRFWEVAGTKKVFLFHGQMGAGKTTIINALCKVKGVEGETSSPTFSIINQYAYTEKGIEKALYHIDLYRLKSTEEVVAAGVEECVYSGAVCFIEWPEKAPELFDEAAVHVLVEPLNEATRQVTVLSAAQFDKHRLKEQL